MSAVNIILDFFAKVVISTISQLIWLLGSIFIFGLLLYFLARFTRITYFKSAGDKLEIFVTGWLGIPVHEIGHAIFCILFRHKITEMKLFIPNPTDGVLGYVNHTYNQNSRFQKIGNFFIGIGPVLFGSFVLYALLYFLMPSLASIFTQIEHHSIELSQEVRSGRLLNMWTSFAASITGVLGGIFNVQNLINWRFWIFLYLSFCVASHMELSPPDIKGALNGLITFVITILLLNFIVMGIEAIGLNKYAGEYWQYAKIDTYASYINTFLGTLSALLIFSLVISALNFVFSYIGLSIYNMKKDKGFINPFTTKISEGTYKDYNTAESEIQSFRQDSENNS